MSIMSLEALESTDFMIEGFQDYIMNCLRESVKPTHISIYDEVGKIGVDTIATVLKTLGFRVERNERCLDGVFSEPFYQTDIYVGNERIELMDNTCIWVLIEKLEELHKHFYESKKTENLLWNLLTGSDYQEMQVELAKCDNSITDYIEAATKPSCVDDKFVSSLEEAGYSIQECSVIDESCVKCPCIRMGKETVKFVIPDESQNTLGAWYLRERLDILAELLIYPVFLAVEEL